MFKPNTRDSASTVMSKVSSDRTFLYSNKPSDFENTCDNISFVSRDRTSVGSVSTISSDRTLLYGNITSPAESSDNNSDGNESSMSADRTLIYDGTGSLEDTSSSGINDSAIKIEYFNENNDSDEKLVIFILTVTVF